MAHEITIRPADEGDRDFVVGLVPSLLEFGSLAWRDPDALRPGFGVALTRALRNQDHRAAVLIAETRDGIPLGFISLKVVQRPEGGERAHVADLAVAQTSRRTGVGTALMEAAEAWARERHFDLIGLDVWSTNDAAVAFYRGLGYSVDALALTKRLD
jgi:GNAT superfamily N-acetyltransferase